MQIFLPASNAIINLICSVHEIKCFFLKMKSPSRACSNPELRVLPPLTTQPLPALCGLAPQNHHCCLSLSAVPSLSLKGFGMRWGGGAGGFGGESTARGGLSWGCWTLSPALLVAKWVRPGSPSASPCLSFPPWEQQTFLLFFSCIKGHTS